MMTMRMAAHAARRIRPFSTMPFAKSFYETRATGLPGAAHGDTWAFTPLANVLRLQGKSEACGRMPSFHGSANKRYVIPHSASILEACKQMVDERLSFLVVVRPSIALGNVVIGVATEHKYVTHGARKILDVGEAERSAFLTGWSLSDSIYEMMTPTDRMIAVTQFDTVQSCVDLLEKKVRRRGRAARRPARDPRRAPRRAAARARPLPCPPRPRTLTLPFCSFSATCPLSRRTTALCAGS